MLYTVIECAALLYTHFIQRYACFTTLYIWYTRVIHTLYIRYTNVLHHLKALFLGFITVILTLL